MRIFVTGASGLIGGDVAARLAARGHQVVAAVHRDPQICGNDGAAVPVAARVAIDLAAPSLGLAPAAAMTLARSLDLIVHCAATTRFDLADAAYRAINTGGTAQMVALAQGAGVPLLHVGTAYVAGTRFGTAFEDDPLPAGGFANGYEASKAAGEALVAASGLPFAIARPSIVLGEWGTGRIRRFDALYQAFRLFATGRLRQMPALPGASLDFVPIDHVAAALVALAEALHRGDPGAAGGRFHLTAHAPIPVDDWAAAIGAYPHLCAPCMVPAARFDTGALPPAERRLFARVAAPYAAYFARGPRFDAAGLARVTGLAAPVTGGAYVRRLIDHAIAAGFLPALNGRADSVPPVAPARPAPTASRP